MKTSQLGGNSIKYFIPIWQAVALTAVPDIELITGLRTRINQFFDFTYHPLLQYRTYLPSCSIIL